MNKAVHRLEALSETEKNRMLEMFVNSFETEPMFRFMFQDANKRREQIRWAVEKKFKLMANRYEIYTIGDGIQGFSWWFSPEKSTGTSITQQLLAGYGLASKWESKHFDGCIIAATMNRNS